jgi:hypothetical protein
LLKKPELALSEPTPVMLKLALSLPKLELAADPFAVKSKVDG